MISPESTSSTASPPWLPSALTLTLPGGQTATAAQSGSTADGLLSGTYYFVVPADLTSATLSVAPGTVAGVVYPDSTGVNDNITFPQPAVFTLTFPSSHCPADLDQHLHPAGVHKNPLPLGKGRPGTGAVDWLIPVAAAVLLGVGPGFFVGAAAIVALVPPAATSVSPTRPAGCMAPGRCGFFPRRYRGAGSWTRTATATAHGSNSVSETSPPSSLSTSEGLPTSHVGQPQGPAVFIVLSHEFPVNQGSLRDSAPLRVLARPEADP